jgi:hypothetical protein
MASADRSTFDRKPMAALAAISADYRWQVAKDAGQPGA